MMQPQLEQVWLGQLNKVCFKSSLADWFMYNKYTIFENLTTLIIDSHIFENI